MLSRKSSTLAATILASSMTFIDATVVNVALPALQASLHATITDVQWVVEAYALFLGLAGEWSDATWPMDSLHVRDAQGRAAAGAIVTLGRALVLQSDGDGWLRFARTEAGPLEARAEHPAVRARVVLLDSQRGVDMTGPVGR